MTRYFFLFTLFTLSFQNVFGQDKDGINDIAYISDIELGVDVRKPSSVKSNNDVEVVEYVEMCGAEIPNIVNTDDSRLALNGVGLRQASFFGKKFDVYLASLHTEEVTNDPNIIIDSEFDTQIDIYFLRDIDQGKLKDSYEWKDGLKKAEFFNFDDELRAELNQNVMLDVKEGQKLSILFSEGEVQFFLDDEFLYSSDRPNFGRALLNVYLVNHERQKLIRGLLGELNLDC